MVAAMSICAVAAQSPEGAGDADQRAIVSQVNRICQKLIASDAFETPNLLVCPPATAEVLLLALTGAAQDSRRELLTALLPDGMNEDRLASGYRRVMTEVTTRRGASVSHGCAVCLAEPLRYTTRFAEAAAERHGAELYSLDAVNRRLRALSGFASERLSDLETAMDLSGDASLPTLSMYSFLKCRAEWVDAFPERDTAIGEFVGWQDARVEATFLRRQAHESVHLAGSYDTLRLALRDCEWVLEILLPKAREPKEVLRGRLLEWLAMPKADVDFRKLLVEVGIPALDAKHEGDLKRGIRALVCDSLFAGLGAMAQAHEQSEEPLLIRGVRMRQRVHLRTDETGIGMTASSELGFGVDAKDPDLMYFSVDRPFALVLRDTRSGLILLAGVVGSPLAR